jgi:hypothetical protein
VPLRAPVATGRRPPPVPGRWPCAAGAQRPWYDGTTHLLFEPMEFLEKLAALTPRPEINLVLCHGVLALPRAGGWTSSPIAARRGAGRRIPARGRGRPQASLLDVSSG